MNIKTFHFNFIQVNTYVLYDDTHEAVIIDPGNCDAEEDSILDNFIKDNKLEVKYIINTHTHIDHILGNGFCHRTYNAPIIFHKAGEGIYKNAFAYGVAFNMKCTDDNFPIATQNIEEGDTIAFGNQTLEVLYTPGHADGSICLLNKDANCIFVGDLIFENSVGRSDLPTGNFRILLDNVRNKILTLPVNTIIYPGHGPETSVGNEKTNNPYIQ